MPVPMNVNEYAEGLLMVCVMHRKRYGITDQLRVNDCDLKPCRTGCPIKNMPQAVTPAELKEIEREVFMDALKEKRIKRLENDGGP